MSHLRAVSSDLSTSDCIDAGSLMVYLTVWGVEPAVTHQTPWLESTGHPVLLTCAQCHFMPYRLFGLAESATKKVTS